HHPDETIEGRAALDRETNLRIDRGLVGEGRRGAALGGARRDAGVLETALAEEIVKVARVLELGHVEIRGETLLAIALQLGALSDDFVSARLFGFLLLAERSEVV